MRSLWPLSTAATLLLVPAFVMADVCDPMPIGRKWCSTSGIPIVVQVRLDGSLHPKVRAAFEGNGVGSAIEEWNFQTDWGNCIPIVLTTSLSSNYIVVESGGTSGFPHDLAQHTSWPVLGCPGLIERAKIIFDYAVDWSSMSDEAVLAVAIHELGHGLGMSDDYICPGTTMNTASPIPSIDGYALYTLRAMYGDLCTFPCGNVRKHFVRPMVNGTVVDFVLGTDVGCAYAGCTCIPEPGSPSFVTAAKTYELGRRNEAGGFDIFATLDEATWSGGTYSEALPSIHPYEVFRLRVRDGAVLVDEGYTDLGLPEVVVSVPFVDEAEPAAGPRVWPNPSVGKLHIEGDWKRGEIGRIEVADVAGRRLLVREVAFPPGRSFVEVDVGNVVKAGGQVLLVTTTVGGRRHVSRVAFRR